MEKYLNVKYAEYEAIQKRLEEELKKLYGSNP